NGVLNRHGTEPLETAPNLHTEVVWLGRNLMDQQQPSVIGTLAHRLDSIVIQLYQSNYYCIIGAESNMVTSLLSSMSTVGAILGAMAVIALIEAIVPLHARGRWSRFHLLPNLALTFTTFGTNILMNAAIVMALAWTYSNRMGLLRIAPLGATAESIVVAVLLDFAFYAVHVAMHRSVFLWRFHCVHHSDPAVDVTTTIRQHPGESVIRYAAIAAVAVPLGASPTAFAIYRLWSVFNGLVEHCNIRVPVALDALLTWVTSTPNMHKIHHSCRPRETNTNYSNIFSI